MWTIFVRSLDKKWNNSMELCEKGTHTSVVNMKKSKYYTKCILSTAAKRDKYYSVRIISELNPNEKLHIMMRSNINKLCIFYTNPFHLRYTFHVQFQWSMLCIKLQLRA